MLTPFRAFVVILQCAIKMIYRNAQPTSERSTHSTEISVLQSISHPHIVSFLESFKDDKCYYLVMEQFGFCWRPAASASEMIVIPTAIEGTTKHSLLSVCNGSSASLFDYIDEMGCIPAYLVRDLFKQLALALGYLHGIGIVHGDIKEENILVGITQENRHIVKLCDFGHARQTKRNHPDLRFYGTRDVSAPELLQNLWSCKPESELSQVFYGYEQDVWALGLVLYTMIHGTLPENNESLVNGDESLTGVSVYPVFFSSGMEKSCLDLLQKMLTIDHHKRITMDGVLNHPFLKRCGIYD